MAECVCVLREREREREREWDLFRLFNCWDGNVLWKHNEDNLRRAKFNFLDREMKLPQTTNGISTQVSSPLKKKKLHNT